MSSCHISGFFALAQGNRLRVNKPFRNPTATTTAGSPGTWYAFYDTTTTCLTDVFAAAQLRVYSPPGEPILPDHTIVYVIGKVCIQPGTERALIDATHMRPVPGDVNDPDYEERVPNFPYSYIDGVGIVSGQHERIDERSRVFPVSVSEYVRDEVKQFQLMSVFNVHRLFFRILAADSACIFFPSLRCLFNGEKPRWMNTKIPNVGTCIHFSGLCSRLLPSGLMAVDLDDVVFNLGAQPPSTVQPPSSQSSPNGKKRKFNAYPPSFQQTVPACLSVPASGSSSQGSQPSEASSRSVSVQLGSIHLSFTVLRLSLQTVPKTAQTESSSTLPSIPQSPCPSARFPFSKK